MFDAAAVVVGKGRYQNGQNDSMNLLCSMTLTLNRSLLCYYKWHNLDN